MGIVTGGLLLNNSLSPWRLLHYILSVLVSGVYDLTTESIKWDHVNLLLFLWVLGILVYLLQNNGHLAAFTQLLTQKFSTAQQAQYFIFFMGWLIFIDDYFKILAVGSIAQTLCHRVGVSRAKLAYLLDTMAAPLCIITPISSWGAVVITTLTGIILTQQITGYTGLSLYLSTIGYNFYALFSLLLTIATILFQSNFGYMQKLEDAALLDQMKKEKAVPKKQGSVYAFFAPILFLIGVTLLTMLITGYLHMEEAKMSWLALMSKTDMEFSMLLGGVIAVLVSYLVASKRPSFIDAGRAGWRIMLGSLAILLLAWAFVPIITATKLGTYLASAILKSGHLPISLLPMPMFIITAAVAFSTGSSWGAFAILLPIASKLALDSDTNLLVPLLGACLGGAIFGDHASPISDTSILASTGASCNHMEHIQSQLPYTFLAGIITLISYAIWSYTYSLPISLFSGSLLTLLAAYSLKLRYPTAIKQ